MYPNQCQSKSNCSHIVRQCCACHHLSCQISHFYFLFRVCHDEWLPHHQLLMRPLPSWSLSELFCSTSWSMVVYLSSSTHVLLLAVLQQWSLIPLFGWFDTSHYYCQVQNLQSKVHVEESTYWFVKTRGYLLKYGWEGNTFLWRRSSTSTCSRVARFDDIFHFGLWMYLFVESSA